MLYRYMANEHFHSSFICELKGCDVLLCQADSFFLPCRICCVFLSSCCCVCTWLALLCGATSGSQRKGSSPALCPSVPSMLRWDPSVFSVRHFEGVSPRRWHGFCMADWFLRSIITLGRTWLTGETPLLLLDITERRSGERTGPHSHGSDQCQCWSVHSDLLPLLGCTLPMSTLWTTLGIFWKNRMSW